MPDVSELPMAPAWFANPPTHLFKPAPAANDDAPLPPAALDGARGTLERLSRELAALSQGARNEVLNQAAYTMGGLAASGAISRAEVESAFRAACTTNGLMRADGPRAFEATFASGFEAGEKRPLTPRPRPEPRPQVEAPSPSLHWFGGTEFVPPKWLTKGILPATGVALIAGQFASGKTFVGLELATCCALDRDFLGRKTKGGGVLWVAAEGCGELDSRIRAALMDKGVDPTTNIALGWTDCPVALSTPQGMQWLRGTVEVADREARHSHKRGLVVVIIDTLAAAFGMEDENDNAAAARWMKQLADLGTEYGVLIIAIAHLGKNAESGVRGASAYGAGADAILNVIAQGDPLTGTVTRRTLALGKSRRGGTGPIGGFELVDVILGQDEDGDDVTSKAVRLLDEQPSGEPSGKSLGRGDIAFRDALDEALVEAGREHVVRGDGQKVRAVALQSVRNLFDRFYVTGEGDAKRKTSAGRTAWNRALNQAHKARLIASETIQSGEIVWRL